MTRVLVVDDYEIVRLGVTAVLEAAGIEVVGTCVDGIDAVEAVRTLSPDVVLMDLMMPVLDGVQATRAVRRAFPDVSVVVLTAAVTGSVRAAFDAGASGYLIKDCTQDELLEAVERAGAADPCP